MATITAETDIKPGNHIMEALLRTQPKVFLKIGDLIEGSLLGRKGAKIFLDLIIKNLKLGDKVTAKVVELENKDGLIELSLKEAGSDMVWKDAKELKESQETLNLKALEANKGGLVLEWRGIKGFLPASQLKASHYPRVEGGDKTKIFDE
ncbi:MAG: RNA binding S1 domain protein, partial [Candidatus Azambacteria bacterium GW2011_GWC2_45_7b]